MFSTLSKTEIIIYVTLILSFANAFNLDKVNFLSSGNGLTLKPKVKILDWTKLKTHVDGKIDMAKITELALNREKKKKNSL